MSVLFETVVEYLVSLTCRPKLPQAVGDLAEIAINESLKLVAVMSSCIFIEAASSSQRVSVAR